VWGLVQKKLKPILKLKPIFEIKADF